MPAIPEHINMKNMELSPMHSIEATLVYLFKGSKCLMLHRVKKEGDIHKNKWNGLGGKMEAGESPEECAVREIQEESGYTINKLDFAGHLFFPRFDKENRDWSVFVFTSTDFDGLQLESTPEGELEWVEKSEILSLNLWQGDRHFIPHLLSGTKFFGKFTYENGSLSDFKVSTF